MRQIAVVCALVLCVMTPGTPARASQPSLTAVPCTSSVGPGIPPPASVPSGIQGFHAAWYGQSGYMTLCPGETSTATVRMEDYGIFWQITVPDTVPPSISRAITANASTVLVSFSEDMKCSTDGSTGSIATGTNYTVATSAGSAVAETITATPNPSCTQASLALSDPLSVGAQYTLTASNVQDAAGNTITDAGRSATFTVVVGEIYGLITRRAPDLIVRSENDPRSLGT